MTTVFTYGEGHAFAVAASAGVNGDNVAPAGALVVTSGGAVVVSGGLTQDTLTVSGAATFGSTVSLDTTTTAGIVVKTTLALQMPQTSVASNPSTYTVRFAVKGANGITYYIPGTTSAS